MSDITDKLAALPEIPEAEDYCLPAVNKWQEAVNYHVANTDALAARLRLCAEMIAELSAPDGHYASCSEVTGPDFGQCDCGYGDARALLAKLKEEGLA